MKTSLFIKNAKQLINPISLPDAFGKLEIIEDGAIACCDSHIITYGQTDKLEQEIEFDKNCKIIDASDKFVSPGFVDPHTHPIFWGTREKEFLMRIKGKSYREISEAGGGIRNSVRNLRKASEEQLIEAAIPRLDNFLKYGTTTIEAKSGYGLTLDSEIKMLRVIKKLNQIHEIDIIPTFLGAHEIPDEYRENREKYIQIIIDEMIPRVVAEDLAEFCDIFCEEHVFKEKETERILSAAANAGLKLKVHADQLTSGKGSLIAAKLNAVSADHLDHITAEAMEQLKNNSVTPVLLPGAVFFLGLSKYSPAREMINMGLTVALATDFNPGSCMTESMQILLTIACINMKMLPEEAWIAATINAAKAIDRESKLGNFEQGKKADIIIWNAPNFDYIPYHYGINHISTVIKNGKVMEQ